MPPMKVAALPLNTTQGTSAALGRQIVNFVCETVRIATGADINSVSYITHVNEDDGARAAFVNVADSMAEPDWLRKLFQESDVDWVSDGLLDKSEDGNFLLKWRFTPRNDEAESPVQDFNFGTDGLFPVLHGLVKEMAGKARQPSLRSIPANRWISGPRIRRSSWFSLKATTR